MADATPPRKPWQHWHTLLLWGSMPALVTTTALLLFLAVACRLDLQPSLCETPLGPLLLHLLPEIGLLGYVSLVMVAWQRHRRRGAMLSTIILLAFYTIAIGKLLVLHEPLAVSDVYQLDELLYVFPAVVTIGLVFGVGSLGYALLCNLRLPRSWWAYALLVPGVGLSLIHI